MRQSASWISAIVIAFSMSHANLSHANLLVNGGFETNGPTAGNTSAYGIGSTGITGWTVVNASGTTMDFGGDVQWISNTVAGLYTPFGTDWVDLTGSTDNKPFRGVTQLVSSISGQAYSLSFYLGAKGTDPTLGGPISASASAGPTSSSPVTSMVYNASGTTGTNSNGTYWAPETLNFTATSASTAITIIGLSGTNMIGLDNVDLEAVSAVPEPSTWPVLLSGIAILCIAGFGKQLCRPHAFTA